MFFRRFGSAALTAILLATGVAAQPTSGLSQFLNQGFISQPSADPSILTDLVKYYQLHADVRLGAEQRLANGVAWRLLTDVRTRAAMPRLTWMADRRSLLKANELFDALQGGELAQYDAADLERRRLALYEWSDGKPPSLSKPYAIKPERVAVTYATSRLVSYVEVISRSELGVERLDIQGRVLDLERGEIWEIDGCPPTYYSGWTFNFGAAWLDVCNDEAYDRFSRVQLAKTNELVAKARARGADVANQLDDGPSEFHKRFTLYLTPAGLAVVDKLSSFPAFESIKGVVINPVILPYRELGFFMKPGSWRDDVLSQAEPR
jgi:hypothetical protein